MNERATKETWKNIPIDNPKQIEIDLFFTDNQFSQLTQGFIPQQMEDKWFIYYDNEWLYIHRSWTGYGIYKAQLHQTTNGFSIQAFWAERNPEKHNYEYDQTDIEQFTRLIARLLLGIDAHTISTGNNIK